MALERIRERILRLPVDAQGLLNKRWGVSDPIQNLDVDDQEDPEAFISQTIDNSGFQFWVVFVAGIGFLTDAYDIFALNTVITIFRYLYQRNDQNSPFPHDWDSILLTSTLAGICLGTLIFGILGDVYGRRKMYGLELTVLIVGSVASSMASRGEFQQMSLIWWLGFWRVIMGIGIGADYPLSAVITSEFAPKRWRARMLATVFWMQPVGQLIVLAIATAVIKASKSHLSCIVDTTLVNEQSSVALCNLATNRLTDPGCKCAAQLDSAWRAIVGVGAAPAAIALYFRMTIPPSPRFRMDVLGMAKTAVRDTREYYIGQSKHGTGHGRGLASSIDTPDVEMTGIRHKAGPKPDSRAIPSGSSSNSHEDRISIDQHPRGSLDDDTGSIRSLDGSYHSDLDRELEREYPKISREGFKRIRREFKDYFWTQGNWRLLLGTAGAWFLLDIPYYGLGLSFPTITDVIWPLNATDIDTPVTVYDSLQHALEHQLVITSIVLTFILTKGAVVGGAICIVVIQAVSPKQLQFWSFIILSVLLLVTGIAFTAIQKAGFSGLVVLYTIMQLFFQLGPNTTTYIISAELWPTKFRCTCHGISAAAGKIGAIVGQLIIAYGFKLRDRDAKDQHIYRDTGNALKVFFGIMLIGAAVTWIYVPETRDPNGTSYSLTDLAKGLQLDQKRSSEKGNVPGNAARA